MLKSILLLSLCMTPVCAQEIYKVVNADGTVTYTDKPAPNAKPVELGPDNRMSMAVPVKKPKTAEELAAEKEKAKPKPTLEVISPEPEGTVRNNAGNMTISAQVTNPDEEGRYQLYFNGNKVSEYSAPVFELKGVNRGAHTFYIKHIDKTGKTLASTPPQTFYLHQASRLIN